MESESPEVAASGSDANAEPVSACLNAPKLVRSGGIQLATCYRVSAQLCRPVAHAAIRLIESCRVTFGIAAICCCNCASICKTGPIAARYFACDAFIPVE